MIQAHEIEALKLALPLLSKGDKEFAGSLIGSYAKKGTLSEKQAPWVFKLIEKAVTPPAPQKTVTVGDLSKLYELFDMAGKNLKFPSVVLKVGDRNVKIYRAGPTSKVPGAVNVVDRAADLWFGRVDKAGVWTVSAKCDRETETALTAALAALAANPAQVAAEYGKLTGECCFCAKPLTDPKSTDVGYGPTCAKKWGLPHGLKAKG